VPVQADSSSSSSESSSSDEADSDEIKPQNVGSTSSDKAGSRGIQPHSAGKKGKAGPAAKAAERVQDEEDSSSDSNSSDSEESEGEGQRDKSTDLTNGSVKTPVAAKPLKLETPATFPAAKKQKAAKTKAPNTPFRRVQGDIHVDSKVADNSFEAKAGSRGSWGEKANKDLKFTKGVCILA